MADVNTEGSQSDFNALINTNGISYLNDVLQAK